MSSEQLSFGAQDGSAQEHFDAAASRVPITVSTARPISRDEMNLAEFPLTVLSTRSNPKLKTLEFSDNIRGKSGELVERKWIITGADKFGLPTASDDEVLLGLIKLTVDDGFRDRKIFFTRYELLRILRWTTEGRSYERLQRALDRLSGVRIKATNAFYDNETKSHSTRNFGILDGYEINDGRSTAPKPSFFTWSDVIFKSFQVGFIKKLDLDFYLNLQSAVTKRLYRYLDKHFWYKSRLQVNLFVLAHEKVGISRNYAYASSLRQQLDPAIEELVNVGFLAGAEYRGKGKDTDVVLIAASGKPRSLGVVAEKFVAPEKSENRANPQTAGVSNLAPIPRDQIIAALVSRGIREAQARRLIEAKTEEQCARVREIIAYFDSLCASPQQSKMKSPVGFLYRAVERVDEFTIPGQKTKEYRPAPQSPKPRANVVGKSGESSDQQSAYLVERKRQAAALKADMEPEVLRRLSTEVEAGLSKLRAMISIERFHEAVEHAVEEKVLKLFAFPSYEEWLTLNKTRHRKAH